MRQLLMMHPDCLRVSPPTAPAGYLLRSYQNGDEQAWADIVNATDMAWPYDVSRTRDSLTRTKLFDATGLFFACEQPGGRPVATACAYSSFSHGRLRPTLHMVAAYTDVAGHGLGKLVCQAVLHHFGRSGHGQAILTTDDHRIPAIVTYLQLGFIPCRYHRGEDHQARWQDVFAKLSSRCGALRFSGAGKPVSIGVLGLRRGLHLASRIGQHPAGDVIVGCDWKESARQQFLAQHPAARACGQVEELLEGPAQALLVANYLPDHATTAVAALRAGKDVLSEVTAFYSPGEGVELVEAVRESGRQYMLAENCLYSHAMLELGHLARSGTLGEMRYAEGDYLHDIRHLMMDEGNPTWRAHLPPLVYCTHPLGPILRASGARPVRVVGMHAGSAMPRTAGGIDLASMLIQCSDGSAIRIATGFALNREPPSLWVGYFGTAGGLETDRWDDRVHVSEALKTHVAGPMTYRPTGRDDRPTTADGHFQADPRMMEYWLESLANGLNMPIDVYEGADMTLPGLLGHRSSVRGNVPLDVPDFRDPAQRDAWRGDDVRP